MSDSKTNLKIGIIGGGVLGSAAKQYYKNAKVFDVNPDKSPNTLEEVMGQDFVFICVPTLIGDNGGGIDLSHIEDVFGKLKPGPTYILKSTVVPGTTESLQGLFPDLKIVYSPEFLTEKFAAEDFAFPDKNIVGFTSKHKDAAAAVARILPTANTIMVSSTEAETIKYALNSYYAIKVIFGNELFELCEALNINYNAVHRGLVADKRVNNSHFQILHGDFRGFGGHCLPKDTAAIVKHADDLGVDMGLIRAAIESNKKFKEIRVREDV
jgi:UDPglucose 6-dehydrogenase